MGPPATRRRFTLIDAMILVAAAAAALAVLRWTDVGKWVNLLVNVATPASWWTGADELLPELILLLTPPVLSATLAMLALRLLGPRPRRSRLARQPGFVACLVAAMAWPVAGVFALVGMLDKSRILAAPGNGGGFETIVNIPYHSLGAFAELALPLGGFAVVVAWATLALGDRWRPEPSWIDRLGRTVGLGWIALGLAEAYTAMIRW